MTKKHSSKKYFLIFYVTSISQIVGSILQLLFPRPPDPNVADSAGLFILQTFYGIPNSIHLLFATVFGIYLAAITTNYLKNKLFGYAVSLILLLSIPIYFSLFFIIITPIRNYFDYIGKSFILFNQDAVLLCALLPIIQLLAVWIFNKRLTNDIIEKLKA